MPMYRKPWFGFALEYVGDIEKSKRFYAEVLGFEVERSAPVFVQFADHYAIATDDSMTGSKDLELYWIVEDALAAFNDFSQHAEISLPITQKPFGLVFGIKDPDGQPRYFVQFAETRPSEAV